VIRNNQLQTKLIEKYPWGIRMLFISLQRRKFGRNYQRFVVASGCGTRHLQSR
jgi:hypothetical protein